MTTIIFNNTIRKNNLSRILTKEQKDLLIKIIRKNIMQDDSEFTEESCGIKRRKDGATLQKTGDDQYFTINYTDNCLSISIHFTFVLADTYEGLRLWFGKDKDIEDGIRCGWYSTWIHLEDKTTKESFSGTLNSIPEDIYYFLWRERIKCENRVNEKIEKKPDISSILVKVDNC